MLFDFVKAKANTKSIFLEVAAEKGGATKGRGRIHPVIKFRDAEGNYICEVRYGDAKANALQRGLWTHTKNVT